jgi:hypothetical protein
MAVSTARAGTATTGKRLFLIVFPVLCGISTPLVMVILIISHTQAAGYPVCVLKFVAPDRGEQSAPVPHEPPGYASTCKAHLELPAAVDASAFIDSTVDRVMYHFMQPAAGNNGRQDFNVLLLGSLDGIVVHTGGSQYLHFVVAHDISPGGSLMWYEHAVCSWIQYTQQSLFV